jgi:putative nucleotidyltransferase with HDIG domain
MKVINLDDIKHGIRVANYSTEFAKKLSLTKLNTENLYISGLFHDIGKAYINQSVLNKPGKLTEHEKILIIEHPIYGYKEVLNIGYSKQIALNILHHHENWDGSGYPKGLSGLSIPIGARILKLSDVFDALTMNRPYREKLTAKEALSIMDKEKSTYDPDLYEVFSNYIYSKYKDQVIRPNLKNEENTLIYNREASF